MAELLTFFEVGDRFGTVTPGGEARVWFVNAAGLPELVVPIEYGCGTTATERVGICHGDTDGECVWEGCPQLADGEPVRSGRHCPLDRRER